MKPRHIAWLSLVFGCVTPATAIRNDNKRLNETVVELRAEKRAQARKLDDLQHQLDQVRSKQVASTVDIPTLPVEVVAPPGLDNPNNPNQRVVGIADDGAEIVYEGDAAAGKMAVPESESMPSSSGASHRIHASGPPPISVPAPSRRSNVPTTGDRLEVTRRTGPAPSGVSARTSHGKVRGDSVADKITAEKPGERTSDAGAEYRAAVDTLKAGKHDEAVIALRAFIQHYPRHDYADNAQYWIGEAFYAQKNYPQALTEFRATIEKYPRGNKVPDALLKVGYCYFATGQSDKGKATLEQVVNLYPKSEPAVLAAKRLEDAVNKRVIAGIVLAPGIAVAQPFSPGPNAPDVPTSLDPAREGTQNTARPSQTQSQPTQPSSQPVIIVGPDGKITTTEKAPPPTNFYVGGGSRDGYDQPDVIHAGPTPELHIVRHGDTLWDICFYYFNDPWQWPKIWSYNAQITNPHWIYPGDLVRLLPRGVFATQPGVTAPDTKPGIDLPPPTQRTESGLKQVAFVEKDDLERSITITGTVDEKTLLGPGDEVYLSYPGNKPPDIGKIYSIYIPDNPVKGYGSYVRLLGTIRIDSVKQDKHARGTIIDANREIERGAKVGPLMKTFTNPPFVAPQVDAQANIVAMLTSEQLIGQGEVVFIDLGEKSGIEVGNRMYVVRRGDGRPNTMDREVGQDDRRFPARALGQIVIVEVGKNISIGLVTLSVQEMSVGDNVMMQKAK